MGGVGFPETTFVDPAQISTPKLESCIYQHYHLLLVLPRSTLTVKPQRKQTKGVLAKSVLNLSLHGLLGGALSIEEYLCAKGSLASVDSV